jgi:hypothetical protein
VFLSLACLDGLMREITPRLKLIMLGQMKTPLKMWILVGCGGTQHTRIAYRADRSVGSNPGPATHENR